MISSGNKIKFLHHIALIQFLRTRREGSVEQVRNNLKDTTLKWHLAKHLLKLVSTFSYSVITVCRMQRTDCLLTVTGFIYEVKIQLSS